MAMAICERVEVVYHSSEKGLNLRTKVALKQGDVVLREKYLLLLHEPLSHSSGVTDCERDGKECGTEAGGGETVLRHLPSLQAALLFLRASEEERRILSSLYCPDYTLPHLLPSSVLLAKQLRVHPLISSLLHAELPQPQSPQAEEGEATSLDASHTAERPPVDFDTLLRIVWVWAYNAFDFGDEEDGVHHFTKHVSSAVFQYACRMNHSCLPSTCWYREGEELVVIALEDMQPGDELTQCYIGLADKFMPAYTRRNILQKTKGFMCMCERCVSVDSSRGFRCQDCGHGIFFLDSKDGLPLPCGECGKLVSPEIFTSLLEFETEQSEAMKELSRNQWRVKSIEMLRQRKQLLKQKLDKDHWVVIELEDMQFHWYNMIGEYEKAVRRMKRQINFLERVFPRPNLRTATCYQHVADALAAVVDPVQCQSPVHRLTFGAMKPSNATTPEGDNKKQLLVLELLASYDKLLAMSRVVLGPNSRLFNESSGKLAKTKELLHL